MDDMNETFDAIVVGSGATGGWAAMDLTAAGMRVLLLEAGPLGTAAEAPRSMATNSPPKRGKLPAWARTREVQYRCYACTAATYKLFVDDLENPYETTAGAPFDWIRSRHFGGRSLTWNGHCYRMSDRELKAASWDGYGEDWPIGYDDLRPHYDRVEQLLGVHGEVAGIPNFPDGIFAGTPELTVGEEHLRSVIEKQWPTRRVTKARYVSTTSSDEGWPTRSSPGSTLAVAQKSGRLTVRPESVVARVLVDGVRGRASGIEYIDARTKERHVARADFVVLCASTIESTRILLNSRTAELADGAGNSSGTLGRYLADHTYGVAWRGIAPMFSGYSESQTRGNGLYVPSFRNADTPRECSFLRGYSLQVQVFPWLFPSSFDGLPGAREKHVASALKQNPPAYVVANYFGEVLSQPSNRVSLDPVRRDAWGLPVPRIECRYGENEIAMFDDVKRVVREMMGAAGFQAIEELESLNPPGRSVHEVGTARMGTSAATSVLDSHCRSWDIPNLFVMDGSCFVSTGYQNPTLTMLALCARACSELVRSWRTGQ